MDPLGRAQERAGIQAGPTRSCFALDTPQKSAKVRSTSLPHPWGPVGDALHAFIKIWNVDSLRIVAAITTCTAGFMSRKSPNVDTRDGMPVWS
jgi:hypothetical protein